MIITKAELLALCDTYLGSGGKTESWLQALILALGNQTAKSLIVTNSSIEQVYDCIQRLQRGMTN